MSRSSYSMPLIVWTGWLLLSLFLNSGPEAFRDRLLGTFQAGSALALNFGHDIFLSKSSSSESKSGNLSELHPDERLLAENRQLTRLIAELKEENEQLRRAVPLVESKKSEDLATFETIPAKVIGRRGDQLTEGLQLLISLGKEQGMTAGEIAISGSGYLIDQGLHQGLQADQLLTAGRSLYGRVIRVGNHTSLVQPVTDSQFRMAIRIVRRSSLGIVQGPKGILAGTGEGCRLTEVSATEAVAAGDEVYTDRLVTPGGDPIYCGRVINAEAPPGDHHWTIEMAPAHDAKSIPPRVMILRTSLNPTRLVPPEQSQ